MRQTTNIALLEQLAHSVQDALKTQPRGKVRNQFVARLARLDRTIAGHKDHFGFLGKDACFYLED